MARLLAILAFLGGMQGDARAQSVGMSSATCPPGNLLAGKLPVARSDVRGSVALATDGAATEEGAQWNSTPAVILETPSATLTWDLGAAISVRAVYLQADANDTYRIFGSFDGRSFQPLAEAQTEEGHGLRSRSLTLSGSAIRFLRLGEGQGDNSYSLSEVQAFCEVPNPFPPVLRKVAAPVAAVGPTSWWNDVSSARVELGLALAGLLLLGWGLYLARTGRPDFRGRLRDRLLMLLGVVSFCAYFNFGSFHFGNVIHNWEFFHYYVGSKYFRELSYDRLYECVAVGDSEMGMRRKVELRKVTNLRTNVLEKTTEILAHPERCKDHFTPERWEAFKRDTTFFRKRVNGKNWEDAQTDHGYNGTPVWNIMGSVLANLAPASNTQIVLLALLDPAYILGMAAMVGWAFGWRILCVALLVFATNFPSRYFWTGGAFLRQDWLFFTVAGVCLMRRERFLLAGMALAHATLLRVFPGFVLVLPLIAALRKLYVERKVDRQYLNLFGGAALAIALMVPASMVVAGKADVYVRFVQNTQKHKETPLTNYMGLRTLVAYRFGEAGRHLRNNKLEDPWSAWKDARLKAFREGGVAYLVLVAAFLWLLTATLRFAPLPWMTAALGAGLIAVGVELTCYYYSFLVALALLHEKRPEVGVWLLGLTAATQFAAWAPVIGMPTWTDEQYTLMSVITLIPLCTIPMLFARPPPEDPVTGEPLREATERPVPANVKRRKRRR